MMYVEALSARTHAQTFNHLCTPHKNVTHPQILLDGHSRETFRHIDFRVPDVKVIFGKW